MWDKNILTCNNMYFKLFKLLLCAVCWLKIGYLFKKIQSVDWSVPLHCSTLHTHWWGDILKSIFLHIKLSLPCSLRFSFTARRSEIDSSLSRFWCWVWKEIFYLRQARWPGAWVRRGDGGTRLCCAVEMAVSIKYHFQFPCFMIPGLLSTNNPPSAGPPTLSWGRLITLVASYKKDIYMKIRKQLLCLHESESRKKAIPNLIFIQRRGEITISWRLIWVSFGGRAKKKKRKKQGQRRM